MVINLKKIVVGIIFLVVGLITVITYVSCETRKTSATPPLVGKKIVIDAGHGGIDGGAVSQTGISEKEINLQISNFLKDSLEKNGAKVIMTRTSDKSLHSDDKGSVKSKKRSDLLNRRNIVNDAGADIFISIHLNFFEQSKYKGAQVFYETLHPESMILAETVQQELKNALDKENNRQISQIDSSKLLFQNLNVPSILVECGFLSNPEECEKLTQRGYQEKIAWCINLAITKFFIQKSA